MVEKQQGEIDELADELDIILSVKNDISDDEINNLVNKFTSLSEYDVRQKISEVTGDDSYIKNLNSNDVEQPIEDANDDNLDTQAQEIINTKEDDEAQNLKLEVHEHEIIGENIKDKIAFAEDNIPDVTFVSGDIKYGQLSVEWGWPEGIDRVLLCYKMDGFPVGPKDSSARHLIIERENGTDKGDYTINKAVEGNYYFCVYAVVQNNENELYSTGQRRLIVNKMPDEIFYDIKVRKTLFGKLKSAELVIHTGAHKEIELPELVLVSRAQNMPIQKCDGESIFNVDYQTLKEDEERAFELPIENLRNNTYVKLFFADDSNSKLFRIISPAKEKLHFK